MMICTGTHKYQRGRLWRGWWWRWLWCMDNKSISDILHLQHLPLPHHHLFVYFNVYLFVCYNHSQDHHHSQYHHSSQDHHYSQYHHHSQYHHYSHDCHHFQDINQHHHLIYHLLHSYLIQLFCFLTCYKLLLVRWL